MFPKKTVKQMKVVKTRAKAEAARRCDVSADSVRENAENAVNKARSVSGEAKPLLERKSGEFCASRSGASPPGLETGPRSENTGKNILSAISREPCFAFLQLSAANAVRGFKVPGYTSSLCVGNC